MKLSSSFGNIFQKFKKIVFKTDTMTVSKEQVSKEQVTKKELTRIVEEDGLIFAITGANKTLNCASVHGLLNYLIDVRMNDLAVIYAFLLHHQLFIKSWNLLEILIEKWKEKVEDNTDHGRAQVFRYDFYTNTSVANILKFWIDNFFLDIKNDSKNVEFITEFFNNQSRDFKANSMFVILAESVEQKLKNDNQLKKLVLINPPKSVKPSAGHRSAQSDSFLDNHTSSSSFVLLDFDALELARQLTLIDFHFYQGIEPREFLDSNWKKKEKLSLAPNIGKLVIWTNSVSTWIICEILNVKDIKTRAATLERIIAVGTELIKIKNFNSIRAIIGAIFNPNISRLRKTFNMLPPKIRESLKEITDLVSDKDNYKVLREKVNTLSPPLLPYPELYYSDLLSQEKLGDLSYEKNGETWVNVEKMVATSFIIKGILNYQKSRFHFEKVKEIQDHITTYPKLSAKAIEEASLKLEP